MPIFEYKCKKCGQVTEILVHGSRKEQKVCTQCGSKEMEKLFSTFSPQVNLDGTGSKCQGCSDQGCPYSGGN